MLSHWGQIKLLTWKNYTLQKRRPIGTAFELFIPLVLTLAMLSLRGVIEEESFDDKSFCDQHVGITDGGNGTSACLARQWIGPNFMANTEGDDDQVQYYDTIAFAPNSSAAVIELMGIVRDELTPLFSANGKQVNFISLAADADYAQIVRDESPLLFAAVIFANPDQLEAGSGQTPQYQLRLPSDLPERFEQQRWNTENNYPVFDSSGSREYINIPYFSPSSTTYYNYFFTDRQNNGFLLMQAAVDRGIATLLHPTRVKPQSSPRLKSYPFPAHTDDNFIFVIRGFFPLILVLSFLYTAMSITRALVQEKETRMREAMRMMGLPSWVNWLAWFIKDFVKLLIVVALIAIIFNVGGLVTNSSNFTVFMFLVFFAITIIAHAFLISTFFSTSNVGGIVSMLVFYLLYQPYQSVGDDGVYETMTFSEKAGMCLAAPSCMGVGARILSQFEARGIGLQLSNLSEDPSDGDSFSMDDVIGFLVLDTLWMWTLAWYVDKVFPGQYGIPLHPLFFLDRTFWTGATPHGIGKRGSIKTNTLAEQHPESEPLDEQRMAVRFKDDFEPVAAGHEIGISVENLVKEWPTEHGVKRAVDGVTMDIPTGSLTVLLGTNGAGKTTALNMITGLVDATAGNIRVNGHDMRDDTKHARESIGYCPQFDILWDLLTVREHMYFYQRLRGIRSRRAIAEETKSLLSDINLEGKVDAKAGTLSGGQKRALSVSLALAGGTQTVILDEPTSGMDPQKRRRTWDMVLKRKEGRTLILTTHHMDEADVLGDRIVIMKAGQLRCAGTPLFLKNRFECGYYLVAVKEDGCDTAKVTEVVKKHVPHATLQSDYGAELSYSLPKQSAAMFGKLFEELESREKELKIDSCGASMTTLEQVFLRIALGTGDESPTESPSIDTDGDASLVKNEANGHAGNDSEIEFRTGWNQLYDQCAAMLFKRSRHFMRNKKMVISQIVVPTFFMLLALVISTQVTRTVDDVEPCRRFDTLSYDSNTIWVSSNNTGFDTQPSFDEQYFSTVAVMGSLDPTPSQTSLASTATSLAATGSLFSTSAAQDVSGQNLTAYLLQQARNYKKTEFYRKAALSTSINAGQVWLDDACAVRSGTSYAAVGSVTIAAGGSYVFQRVAADFGNAGSSETFSLSCPTACNSTGGTQKPFCDFNSTRNSTYGFTATWQQQCGNNPQVQWVEVLPTAGEVGLDYTVTCAGGTTLTVTVASASDPSLYNTTSTVAVAWYNRQAFHTSAEALNFAGTAIAREHLGDSAVTITTSNCPLPKSNEELARDEQADDLALNLGINVGLAVSFLVGSFALFPVNERNQKSKHIQLVSGLDVRTYWLTSFVWDYVTSLVPFVLFLVLFAAFGIDELEGDRLGIVFLLLLLFGFAAIPCVYCLTFLFKTSAGAYTLTVVLFFFTSLVMTIVTFILPLLNDGEFRKNGVAEDCKNAFLINPVFALSQGIVDVYNNNKFLDFCKTRQSFCDIFGYKPQDDYFSMDGLGVGANCLALALEGVFFTLLLLLIEKVNTLGHAAAADAVDDAGVEDQDEDVWKERVRVRDGGADGEIVVARELTRSFGDKLAVDKVTFGVPQGQCFGLLGTNGAGKTTCFRMLTGELGMTRGAATVSGSSVASNLNEVRRHMGYTPQYDGLIPHLTGRDHLVMFARMRGMPVEKIPGQVNRMISRLDLEEHADHLAGTYSGGNKRKLSTAIALIGKPKVVLLDEPTSGIDPAARRMLWNTVLRVVREGTTVILTTHSMEEVEALCSRLTIMVAGKLKCLGSLQHLKGRFGKGFYLTIKLKPDVQLSQFMGAVRNEAAAAHAAEGLELEVLAQFDLSVSVWVRAGASLGQLFTWMESPVLRSLVSDYAVNQPSLEQVFLGFAKLAEAEEAAEREKAEHSKKKK